jgi:hypothetical protein
MYDSLQWITCYNPHKKETHMGLNMHGETIIPPSSSWKAAIVFETWAKLFGLGPEQLHLEGAFVTTVGPPNAGHYDQLVFDRDSTTDTLLQLADQCRRAETFGGKAFILHSGI